MRIPDLKIKTLNRAPTTDNTPGSAKEASKKLSAPSLFSSSSFAKLGPVTFEDGTSIALPSMSASELKQANTIFAGVDDETLKAMQAAGLQIGQAFNQAAMGQTQPQILGANNSGALLSTASLSSGPKGSGVTGSTGVNLLSSTSNLGTLVSSSSGLGAAPRVESQLGPAATIASPQLTQSVLKAANTYQDRVTKDYDKTVQAVTYAGLQGLLEDLSGYAKQVQSNLNDKKSLQIQAQDITNELANWPDDNSKKDFAITSFNEDGKKTTVTKSLTKDQAREHLKTLESAITTFSDQSQIDQLNLQQMSQNYSQGLSTISNILKMNYDTVKGIIGNIRSS